MASSSPSWRRGCRISSWPSRWIRHWIDALAAGLGKNYEHRIEVPLENGYGLCVMSKLPLSEVEVRELVTREVPSIRARVHLPVGEDFRLYVVHPEPPVFEHDTKGRDSEIAMVGIEAEKDPLPAVVTGDSERCSVVDDDAALPTALGAAGPARGARHVQHLQRDDAVDALAARSPVPRPAVPPA